MVRRRGGDTDAMALSITGTRFGKSPRCDGVCLLDFEMDAPESAGAVGFCFRNNYSAACAVSQTSEHSGQCDCVDGGRAVWPDSGTRRGRRLFASTDVRCVFGTVCVTMREPVSCPSDDVYGLVAPRRVLMTDPHNPLQGENHVVWLFEQVSGVGTGCWCWVSLTIFLQFNRNFRRKDRLKFRLHLTQPSPLYDNVRALIGREAELHPMFLFTGCMCVAVWRRRVGGVDCRRRRFKACRSCCSETWHAH